MPETAQRSRRMDRRNLLRSILALGGAAAFVAIPRPGEAASLFDELNTLETMPLAPEADLPAEGAEDVQMMQRCTWRVDRFGRRVRVCRPVARPRRRQRRCWWTRDRRGRRVRVCR
jgi:hypothetical protein